MRARHDATPGALRLRRARTLVVVLPLLVVVLAVVVAVRALQEPGPSLGTQLGRSMQAAGDGFAVPEGCRRSRVPESVWRCPVEDDPGSGVTAVYRLLLNTDGCWAAERLRPDADEGTRPHSGCLRGRGYGRNYD